MTYSATAEALQRNRLSIIGICFALMLLLVVGRVVQRQVFEHATFVAMAKDQRNVNEELPAERGKLLVYDDQLKDYYPLATNVSLYNLNIVPTQIQRPELVAAKLMPYLAGTEIEESKLVETMKSGKVYVAPLKRRIEKKEADEIKALDLEGVYLRTEEYRYYPEDSLAAQVLGFVNRDMSGQYGLEGYFNGELSGKEGNAQVEKSSLGAQIAVGSRKVIDPENGANIVLTLDRAVQYYVEKKLKESVEKHGATGGEVIIMEPSTGRIIAMASYPTFNPNYYNEYALENFSNPNVSSVYEPGSVFKVLTMAAGIDAGLVSPSTTYTDTGEVKIDDRTIKNSDLKANGVQTMTQVLEKSLNTGAIYVVQKLGRFLFYKYLNALGFDAATGVELDGETPASIRPYRQWGEVDLATMAFGQGIAVTPIQLVAAVGALANQGKLMKPHIVDKIIYPSGAVSVDAQMVRQAIKPQTAQLVSAMMVSVVERGHGQKAGVAGYRIAGKTGTAQIPKGGGYEEGPTIGTFIGFGPVEDPKFVMLTRIDRPKDVQFAESSAAPLFGDIANFLLNYWQIPPEK
ncbi:MAG: penicillin-binding protein 2 [Patescibacteria group bacterium]|jgi:cell division protein FtsI/penicillin-binding protein 2